jgi:Alanine dehydrogenase/PNT, N-terminal domain
MAINIAILKERKRGKKRVAMGPEVVPRVTRLGATLAIESGAGTAATFADAVSKCAAEPGPDDCRHGRRFGRYSGVENLLFFGDNCAMVYGDAQAAVTQMVQAVKDLRA